MFDPFAVCLVLAGVMSIEWWRKDRAVRDRQRAERDELAQAIADMKAESDGLVDKVVATEAERDEYKRKLDEISEGVGDQETRITQLLKQIAELEAVIKMAEKYQLVEKDSFGDDLVGQANPLDEIAQEDEPKKE